MKTLLSDYVAEQARWRTTKAEEYPDDQRNAQSAESLTSLAEYLEHEDAALNRSANFLNGLNYGVEWLHLGEETQRLLSRYGFGYRATSVAQHEAILDELAVQAVQDIYGECCEQGEDASDVLIAAEVVAAERGVHLPQRYWDMRSHMFEPELEDAIASYSSEG